MGTTYVKYPWDTSPGEEITEQESKQGRELFDTVTEWCAGHADGTFNIDRTIYAKGIKVNFTDPNDTKRLKAYIHGVQAFS